MTNALCCERVISFSNFILHHTHLISDLGHIGNWEMSGSSRDVDRIISFPDVNNQIFVSAPTPRGTVALSRAS